jgi:hypothetical protein
VEIRNQTPFPAALNVTLDKRAAEHLVLCVKGTWTISESRGPKLADEQAELHAADVHFGEPGLSSVRYEADFGPMKLATDCALVGSAVPARRGARAMQVSFRVGELRQQAKVVGERRWAFSLLGWKVAGPGRALDRVPLRWEYARGGADFTPKDENQHSFDWKSPVGRGSRARGSKLPTRGTPLPQLLHPRKSKEPVGFGFIGGHWAPRRRFAGTYDQAWQEERCPLLPLDFDERFFNSAAPGLTAKGYLAGGERVEVRGCTRSGKLAFALPSVALRAEAVFGTSQEPMDMKLVTVTVDTDEMKLFHTWRGAIRIHSRLLKLAFVRLESGGEPA